MLTLCVCFNSMNIFFNFAAYFWKSIRRGILLVILIHHCHLIVVVDDLYGPDRTIRVTSAAAAAER